MLHERSRPLSPPRSPRRRAMLSGFGSSWERRGPTPTEVALADLLEYTCQAASRHEQRIVQRTKRNSIRHKRPSLEPLPGGTSSSSLIEESIGRREGGTPARRQSSMLFLAAGTPQASPVVRDDDHDFVITAPDEISDAELHELKSCATITLSRALSEGAGSVEASTPAGGKYRCALAVLRNYAADPEPLGQPAIAALRQAHFDAIEACQMQAATPEGYSHAARAERTRLFDCHRVAIVCCSALPPASLWLLLVVVHRRSSLLDVENLRHTTPGERVPLASARAAHRLEHARRDAGVGGRQAHGTGKRPDDRPPLSPPSPRRARTGPWVRRHNESDR